MRFPIATRKEYTFPGTTLYTICMPFSYRALCTLYSEKLKGRTESYFILFLKLNDHPTRCFNFGLRRIHPNDYKFKSNLKNSNLKLNPSKH